MVSIELSCYEVKKRGVCSLFCLGSWSCGRAQEDEDDPNRPRTHTSHALDARCLRRCIRQHWFTTITRVGAQYVRTFESSSGSLRCYPHYWQREGMLWQKTRIVVSVTAVDQHHPQSFRHPWRASSSSFFSLFLLFFLFNVVNAEPVVFGRFRSLVLILASWRTMVI